jgi:hypothetical protein
MTYKQGCKYALLLGIPCLLFDIIARLPPLYHVAGAHRLAQIILFPGWQVVHWMTGGLVARSFEYKVLLPLLIVALNVLAWGGVVWAVGNLIENWPSRQRRLRRGL